MANLLKKGKKGGWTKLRMLNIEVVAGGLMKLTMQVNSLLRVPHPPPPSSLCPFISLACCEESFGAAWREVVSQVPMHGGFRGADPRSETPVLTPFPSH